MDDLSTLTPHAKYGVKFIDSVMTLFRQGILKLAWEICKKSNNFTPVFFGFFKVKVLDFFYNYVLDMKNLF